MNSSETTLIIIMLIIYFGIIILWLAGKWKVFQKANQPGWAVIVPIYGYIVELEIIKKPTWWIILCLLPLVNFFVLIVMTLELAKAFNKSAAFGLGMVFLPFIFYPILGFGDAKFRDNDFENRSIEGVLDSGL